MAAKPEDKSESPIAFLDNPHAPDIYADMAGGLFLHNGLMRITLTSTRVNHITNPGPASNVVIGRVVMPAPFAEGMARGILELIEKMKTPQPEPSSTQGKPTIQ